MPKTYKKSAQAGQLRVRGLNTKTKLTRVVLGKQTGLGLISICESVPFRFAWTPIIPVEALQEVGAIVGLSDDVDLGGVPCIICQP
jgi:hypothetical protein